MLAVAVMMAVTGSALALAGLPLWAKSEYLHNHAKTVAMFEREYRLDRPLVHHTGATTHTPFLEGDGYAGAYTSSNQRDGTAEPVSRDQILRRVRGQGNVHFFPV